MDVRSPLFQNVATLLIGVMFLNPILATAAELALDAAGGNTNLGQAANGVPIVNIATPNGSGLSHNKFSDYNVGQQGLILNNATDRTQSTQLGGIILGNPNLRGGAAGLILNEVTGANSSQLKGYTEVAGQGAHVIVANPHGITCNGCGFINTPHATLTTGTPIIDSGRLSRFDVDGGAITIEGAGLNASNVEQFDLITRSAKLNAEIYANRLNIITGRNQVDATTLTATAKADDGSAKPQLAIDSSALGGMYAGAIRLVGTEAGVGVKLAGDMAASAGDIQIDSNGHLNLTQVAASNNIQLKAASAELNGKVYAGNSLTVQSAGALINNQSLAARERIDLSAVQLDNRSLIEAGVEANNTRNSRGDVSIVSQSLRNSGSVLASRDLTVQASQSVNNQAGTLSGVNTTITTGQLDNRTGRILATSTLQAKAASLDNGQNGLLHSQGSTTLTVDGALNNKQGRVIGLGSLEAHAASVDNRNGLLASQQQVSLTTASSLNNQTGEVSAKRTDLRVGSLDNRSGKVIGEQLSVIANGLIDNRLGLFSAINALDLQAAGFDNSAQGTVLSESTLSMNVQGLLDNHDQGNLISHGNQQLNAGQIDNHQAGLISSKGTLNLQSNTTNNQGGQVVANGVLTIKGGSLDNSQRGLISSQTSLLLDLSGALDNHGLGNLISEGGLNVKAASVNNSQAGVLSSAGALQVVSSSLNNQGGKLLTDSSLTVSTGHLDNSQAGILSAKAAMTLTSTDLDNSQAGRITSNAGLKISSGQVDNSAKGRISSLGQIDATLSGLDQHDQGELVSSTGINLDLANGQLINRNGGLLASPGKLLLTHIGSVDNSLGGEISSTSAFSLFTGSLDNSGGKIISGGALQLGIIGYLLNSLKGTISGSTGLIVSAASLDNSAGGTLSSRGDVQVDVQTALDNHNDGAVLASGNLTVNVGSLNNSNKGLLSSGKALQLHGGATNNSQGQIISQATLTAQTADLNNQGGTISSKQALSLTSGDINNSATAVGQVGGLISSEGDLTITGHNLDSSLGGELSAKGDLRLTVAQLIQRQGRLIGEQAVILDLGGGNFDNRGGLLNAHGPLTIAHLAALDNRDLGEISSQQSFTLQANRIDNGEQGRLISAGALVLNAATLRNAKGGLLSGWQGLTVQGGSLDNSASGTLSSKQGTLTVNLTGALDNFEQGAMVSLGKQQIGAASLDNRNGILSTEADLSLDVAGALNNSANGLISAKQDLALLGVHTDINNQNGQLSGASLLLKGNSLDNSAGQITSQGLLGITLLGALINANLARLASGGALTLKAASVDNRSGKLISQDALTITSGALNNSAGGTLASQQDMTLNLTGALSNQQNGLIFSQLGKLFVTAQSLNNNAGTLQSEGDNQLRISAALSNQAGQISSLNGNLDLQAGSVDNSASGILNSVKGWIKLVTTGVFDNHAGITQAQSLDIEADQGIDNHSGHLSALTGENRIVTADLNNQGGGLYASTLLKVTGQQFLNQGAALGQGGKVGAEQINFSLSGALNNQFGLIESDSTLDLNAASINNVVGSLRALGQTGSTHIVTGSLNNNLGALESANADLDLQVTSLSNAGGRILHTGSGIFGLSAANVMQAGGSVVSNGTLTMTANSWTNSSVLQAGHLNLNIANFTQTAGGQLLAAQGFTGTGTHWINDGLLASDGFFNLNLTGTYSGAGNLNSLGDLTLAAGGIDLAAAGKIMGGGNTQITSRGTLTNHGRMTSMADLTVSAVNLNNYGTLGSADALRVNATNLLNENGLIFSGADMKLRVSNFTNRYADVYSLGGLDIALDDLGSKAAMLKNVSGTIESANDMRIAVADFENAKAVFQMESKLLFGSISIVCVQHCGSSWGDARGQVTLYKNYTSTITQDSQAGTITAGRDLNIVGDTVFNHYSVLSAARNLSITATDVKNEGAVSLSGSGSRIATAAPKEAKSVYYQHVSDVDDFNANYGTQATFAEAAYLALLASFNPYVYAGINDPIQITPDGQQSAPAIIQAGGNVSITATNDISNIVTAPNSAINSGSSRVESTGVNQATQAVVVLNAQLPPDLAQQQINPTTLPGFSLPTGQNGLFRLSGQDAQAGSASGAATGSAGLDIGGRQIDIGQRENTLGSSSATDTTGSDVTDVAGLGGSVPHVLGLPSNTKPSNGHKYLIETNPVLTELKQFMSSDYLLGLLGVNPDNTQKRLGDGLYEQRLIRDAIVARTGQRFIDGLTSDEAMFRYLMDNAIASKTALNLAFGISLTAAQVAALTHDIVWMEEVVVNGEKVLVPVLYLAQANNRLAPNGALIAGSNVTLIAGNELKNSGTLHAQNNLAASAANINNAGLMEAGKRLDLLATDSIRNAQGGIITGRDVSLIALTGDVINERTVTAYKTAEGSSREHERDFADSAARIEASNRLDISAGRDIANLGGVLQSRGDLSIDAGRDVTLASVEERNAHANGTRVQHEQITQLGSEVSAGRDLDINAGRDLTAIASKIEAKRDIALSAGRDVTLAAAANEEHDASKSKEITFQQDKVEQQSTVLKAGGDVAISAGNDLTLLASKVEAGNEAYLVAGNDLSLLSAADSDYYLYDMEKKGSWGSKKTQKDEVTTVTNVGSAIKTGGDLTLVSGGDQLYQGAKLDSGNDLTLDSGGAITFEAVKDSHQESHDKSSNSWAWTSMDSKGKVDETLRQSQLTAKGQVLINAVDGLHIDVKQINQQTVSQSIDAMVQADPSMAWLKDVEARGDVDWRQVKELHDKWHDSHSGLGGPAMIVIIIIVTYFTAGLASGAVGAAAGATAGSGSALAAGTAATAATATTAATAATAAGWANIAATAVLTSAASTATVSTINNKGNVGAALKETFNSDNLKNYIVAGTTAGLTAGLYNEWTSTQTGGSTALTDSTNGALANGGKVVVSNPGGLSSLQGVGQFTANQALQNTTSAVLNKALGRDGSLGDALQTSLVNTFTAYGFNLVGDVGVENHLQVGGLSKIGLHALMGGLAAEAAGGDFKTGALVGGVNEALVGHLAEQYADMPKADRDRLLVMNSQLIGVLTTALQDPDADTNKLQLGASIAGTATEYNHLDHGDANSFGEDMEACGSDDKCQRTKFEEGKYAEESIYNDKFAEGISGPFLAKDKMGQIAGGLDELLAITCSTQTCEVYKANLVESALKNYSHLSDIAGEWSPSMDRLSLILTGAATVGVKTEGMQPRPPGTPISVGSSQVEKAIEYFAKVKNGGVGAKATAVTGESAGAMRRLDYEAAPYHGKVDNAVKSRAPINGQDALDTAIQVKPTSPRRVGIDYESKEFVVFDKTLDTTYHGHVRSWKDLHPDMQRALQQAGMADRKGNILVGGKQ
jgi:filamentous hemagglutinin